MTVAKTVTKLVMNLQRWHVLPSNPLTCLFMSLTWLSAGINCSSSNTLKGQLNFMAVRDEVKLNLVWICSGQVCGQRKYAGAGLKTKSHPQSMQLHCLMCNRPPCLLGKEERIHISNKHIQVAYKIAGLHWNSNPKAARVAEYTPKLSKKPRTVAMIRNAGIANRFNLKGGTLYTVPRKSPREYSFVIAGPKLRAQIVTPPSAKPMTRTHASAGVSSPAYTSWANELQC